MARNFPHPIPASWYAVAVSGDLAIGEVVSRDYFGRQLAVFRGEDGKPAVLDAHCPHLGAHLAHGGTVVGSRIRCPFHAWEFEGATGVCAHVPYAKRIPAAAHVGAYPTVEKNGFVFAWYHPQDAPPSFELPDLREAGSEDWSTPDRYEWEVRTQIQEMGENGVDSAHFQFVHGALNVPTAEVESDGPSRRNYQPVNLKTPRGEVDGGIESQVYGMGFAITRFTGICETLELACSTPIDKESVHVRYAFTQPRVDGADPVGGVAAAIIRDIVKQMNEDIPIWENKKFCERPILCDGDGPIPEYRRWCKQFYADAP
ncbi:Rieske (2Fe-2S) protein [Myxococcota bacterium]|nr:Rieske (2Fe-2S) protein [Myxococcota bacterium]